VLADRRRKVLTLCVAGAAYKPSLNKSNTLQKNEFEKCTSLQFEYYLLKNILRTFVSPAIPIGIFVLKSQEDFPQSRGVPSSDEGLEHSVSGCSLQSFSPQGGVGQGVQEVVRRHAHQGLVCPADERILSTPSFDSCLVLPRLRFSNFSLAM